MVSRNLFTGTVVLLAAGLATLDPVAHQSETTTSAASVDTTQTATTATESESGSETGTTVIVETPPTVSSAETTTTAAATTTTEGPEAVQSIYIYASGSNDPALASTEGKGYAVLSDTSIPDVEYIDFTTDSSSQLFFTLGERSGKFNIGNGPNAGKLVGYFPTSDYSVLIAVDAQVAEDEGVSPIDCTIVQGNGGGMLQCEYGDKGNADFWTCGGHFTFVRPGYDYTSKCPSGTAYKLDYVQVATLP